MKVESKGNVSGPVGTSHPSRSSACNELHKGDDVDVDGRAHHHTLGWRVGQAAPGNLTNSRIFELEAVVADLITRVETLEGP